MDLTTLRDTQTLVQFLYHFLTKIWTGGVDKKVSSLVRQCVSE